MLRTASLLCLAVFLISSVSFGASIPIGYVSWDVTSSTTGEFDITNNTGPNSTVLPDTTWPVVTPVSLGNLSLTVDFSDGSTVVYPSSYFTLAADGLSYDGGPIGTGGTNPQPTDATLTGNFTPTTIVENDGSVHTIHPDFSATITSSSPPDLQDGDLAIIYATEAGATVPEPAYVSWMLLGTFFLGFVAVRHRQMFAKFRTSFSARRSMQIALLVMAVVALQSQSWAQVKNNVDTSPTSGTSGSSQVNINGSGYPAGPFTAADITVNVATVCFGPGASTPASSITHVLGSSYRVHFTIPSGLATGTYFVSVSDSTPGQSFVSTNCSILQVTGVTAGLNACVPSSSLGVNAPAAPGPVTASVPLGNWGGGPVGVKVVQVEAGGSPMPPAFVGTPGTVNSCAANPSTGQVVCTENTSAVDLITGTSLNSTLFTASNTLTGFTGGSCFNCGVAMDSLNNRAAIAMGLSTAPSGSAIQFLELSTTTFDAPILLSHHVSEDILVDPTRALILSPA